MARGIETEPGFNIDYVRVTPKLLDLTFSEAAKEGPYAFLGKYVVEELPRRAELQLFRIGDTVLMGLPGEPVCDVGRAVARVVVEKAGASDAVVAGLANNYIRYIANEQEYAHGGYEVRDRSYYGPGLGDFIVEQCAQAAQRIRHGKGKEASSQ